MDKIVLKKMAFYGYHGVFPEETRLGQRFYIDLIAETDLKKAGETDNLNDSINYGEIYQICKEIVEGKPYKLIESVAEKIAGEMLSNFTAISQVTVRVIKPNPPIAGHYESVAVEITRGRNKYMNNEAYISLGSNIGDRYNNLKEAIGRLDASAEIEVVNTSSIYETDPVGYENQEQFLNMAIQVKTQLQPFELLDACRKIENELGRKRDVRWGPRTIDLDILLYNQENIKSEKLTVPHPRMQERAFVIIPLLEIDSSIKLPTMENPLCTVLEDISDKEGVRIWKRKNGEDVFALFAN